MNMKYRIDFRTANFNEQNIDNENHDLAIARSSSSRPNPALTAWLEAFKCLNI